VVTLEQYKNLQRFPAAILCQISRFNYRNLTIQNA